VCSSDLAELGYRGGDTRGIHLHMLVDPPGVAAAIAEFGADLAGNPHGG